MTDCIHLNSTTVDHYGPFQIIMYRYVSLCIIMYCYVSFMYLLCIVMYRYVSLCIVMFHYVSFMYRYQCFNEDW